MAQFLLVYRVEVGGIHEIYLEFHSTFFSLGRTSKLALVSLYENVHGCEIKHYYLIKQIFGVKSENYNAFCETVVSEKHRIFAVEMIIVMKLKTFFIAVVGLLLATGCNSQNKQEVEQQKQSTMSKSIVIFFSHAGDNYAVGNIEVGNTKIVADYISEIIGADQFEIVTHKYDGMAYTPLINPFTTHEGSGLANCVEDVKEAFAGANVTNGFSIYGHEVRTEKGKVEKWLKSLTANPSPKGEGSK